MQAPAEKPLPPDERAESGTPEEDIRPTDYAEDVARVESELLSVPSARNG